MVAASLQVTMDAAFPPTDRSKFCNLGSAALQTLVNKGITLAACKYDIKIGATPHLFCINKWKYTDSRPLKPSTCISYLQFFKMLWKFFASIGDWESMLVLMPPPPPEEVSDTAAVEAMEVEEDAASVEDDDASVEDDATVEEDATVEVEQEEEEHAAVEGVAVVEGNVAKPATGRCSLVPSMRVESLMAFLRWKKMESGLPLRVDDQRQIIRHILTRQEMTCNHSWECNHRMKNFGAAIGWVHATHGYGDTQPFEDECSDCLAAYVIYSKDLGCAEHQCQRRIKRKGQPTYSSRFKNCRKSLIDGNYETKGSAPMAVWQMRKLGEVLLGHHGMIGIMFWVIVLIAVNLFLRADCEVLAISMESFLSSSFVIQPNGRIDALCLKIRGKTDKKIHHFYLWADHEHRDICPVRHLLVYIHCLKIKTGFLFPPLNWLAKNSNHRPNETTQGDFTKGRVDYNTALKFLKRQYEEAVGKEASERFAMHSLRKGAYQKGLFQGAEILTLQFDARHQRNEEAVLYLGDAATQLALHAAEPNPQQAVSKPYRGVRSTGTPGRNENATKTLSQLADDFANGLKVVRGPRNVRNLVLAARDFKWEETTGDRLLQTLANVQPDLREAVIAAWQHREKELIQKCRLEREDILEEIEDESTLIMPPALKRVKKPESNYFPGRLKIAHHKEVEAKLNAFIKLYNERVLHETFDENRKDFDESDSKFYARTLKPIMACYIDHCGSSKEQFIAKWGGAAFKMKFYENCCIGEVGECGLKK